MKNAVCWRDVSAVISILREHVQRSCLYKKERDRNMCMRIPLCIFMLTWSAAPPFFPAKNLD